VVGGRPEGGWYPAEGVGVESYGEGVEDSSYVHFFFPPSLPSSLLLFSFLPSFLSSFLSSFLPPSLSLLSSPPPLFSGQPCLTLPPLLF
jgi:hypothetical protein